MDCVTISHQRKIKPGRSVTIHDILNFQISLSDDKQDISEDVELDLTDIQVPKEKLWAPYKPLSSETFIKAQSMKSLEEIEQLCYQIIESNKNNGYSPRIKSTYGHQNTNRIVGHSIC